MVVGEGGVSVVAPYQATIPGLSVLTNITTQDLIDNDPDLVAAYSAAMTEALDFASTNEDAVYAAIAEGLDIPLEAAQGITLPTFTFEMDVDSIKTLADLAVKYEYIEKLPDFDRLIQQQ
jgi:NitT/TauT family transport system substrate-binding protein